MSFSMGDDSFTTTTTTTTAQSTPLPYPAKSTVTRIPVFINTFSERIIAKVKQPQLRPTPVSTHLQLTPPLIVAGDENRFKTLETKESARSTWSLTDIDHAAVYTGSAEQGDPNNRYYLLVVDRAAPQPAAHMVRIRQLNLQKVNTHVRFKNLEDVEKFNKSRAQAASTVKPIDLGLDNNFDNIKKIILTDKLKKQTKDKKAGDKSKSRSGSGGFGKKDDFDFDDGEDVWRVADDDEGIANKDLNDFEDTGDWAGEKKSEFIDDEGDEFNAEAQDINELNAEYFEKDNEMLDVSSDDDGDDDDNNSGPVLNSGAVTPSSVGPKRKTAPVAIDDDDEPLNANGGKRKLKKK